VAILDSGFFQISLSLPSGNRLVISLVPKEGYIYPKQERPVRDLLRRRSKLVQLTANLQSVHNLLARNRGSALSANRIRREWR
jgi:transposase